MAQDAPPARPARSHALDRPLPAELSVADGLEAYLAENGFDRALYEAKWTPAKLFGIPVPVPNTKRHRFAIRRHDLHHVATGYGTDPIGEAEISAWEARGGFGGIGLYTTGIVVGLVLLGATIAPRRTLGAARAHRRGSPNLYRDAVPYDEVLSWSVGELRRYLGVPEAGLAGARALHGDAPSQSARPST